MDLSRGPMEPQNNLHRFQQSPMVGPAAYGQRRDGWCEGVHISYLFYPLLHFKLSPGIFNMPVSLNYWF